MLDKNNGGKEKITLQNDAQYFTVSAHQQIGLIFVHSAKIGFPSFHETLFLCGMIHIFIDGCMASLSPFICFINYVKNSSRNITYLSSPSYIYIAFAKLHIERRIWVF